MHQRGPVGAMGHLGVRNQRLSGRIGSPRYSTMASKSASDRASPEEFVAGHDTGDVRRELVQNEFDAGGSQIAVTFGTSGLTASGKGRPIDAKGWARLDVILGTGLVLGGGEDTVEPKENGIGPKNFGLGSCALPETRIN